MLKFACRNLGVDCDFVATAECPEELKGLAMQHASLVHADMLKAMSEDQKAAMSKAVEDSIKASAAPAMSAH